MLAKQFHLSQEIVMFLFPVCRWEEGFIRKSFGKGSYYFLIGAFIILLVL
jgi:hypothetical protein